MIEKLCGLYGVSGDEADISAAVSKELKKHGIEYEYMKNGNLIAYKKGRKTSAKKLMICAHMDEVGFIVTDMTEDGYLKFDCVGGIDKRILLSKRVFIGENRIPGIIGIKAIHLTDKEERKKSVDISRMYIDIGAKSKKDALKYVGIGDYAYFEKAFYRNKKRMISKAFDDRAGVALLVELLKSDCEYGFTACFNIAEEIGTKGSLVSARKIKPDYGIILEGTTCSDTGGTPANLRTSVLGDGPAISIRDFGAHSDRDFNKFITELADEKGIKYQLKRNHRGGNDSAAVQLAGDGVKTAAISVPVRYIHSPAGIMDKNDYENAYKLVKAVADNFGKISEGFK